MILSRKISLSTINELRGSFPKPAKRAFVGRVFGIVQSVSVEDAGGQFFKFIGEFRAVNAKGVESGAPVCTLPEPAATALASACKKGIGAQFGYDFWTVPAPESRLGYAYEFSELVKPAPHDSLAHVASALPPVVLDTDEPKADEPKADEPKINESKADEQPKNKKGGK